MTSIRDFVASEPLFETHTHQNRFNNHPWATKNYEEFVQYGTADLATASNRSWEDLVKSDQVFDYWRFVATTGYGQAAQLGCRDLFGLDYTQENAPAITRLVKQYVSSRTPERIFADLYRRANVRWSVCDQCWEDPVTTVESMSGKEHLDLMHFAIRHDALLMPTSKADVTKASKALGKSIRSLDSYVKALDDYTAKAKEGCRLAAIKIGLAYMRNLDFAPASKATAERLFGSLMQGRRPGQLKPLHDYLFFATMDRARELKLPVQIHTGFLAGNYSDIRRGDPSGLVPVFQRYKDVRFDLFHAAWPWSEFLGAVGKEFPNVWLDLCWMWSMNPVQAERVLDEWLSAVPCNKIFGFGADTGSPFGLVGYGLQARQGIAAVLEKKIGRGEYDEKTARFVAGRVMSENAREFYGM